MFIVHSKPHCFAARLDSLRVVSAERFLARPLGMGSGGGGNDGTLALHSHLTPSGRFRIVLQHDWILCGLWGWGFY